MISPPVNRIMHSNFTHLFQHSKAGQRELKSQDWFEKKHATVDAERFAQVETAAESNVVADARVNVAVAVVRIDAAASAAAAVLCV